MTFSKNWLVHHVSVTESHSGKFVNEKNNRIFRYLQSILASKRDHQAKTRYTTESGLSHNKQHNKKEVMLSAFAMFNKKKKLGKRYTIPFI